MTLQKLKENVDVLLKRYNENREVGIFIENQQAELEIEDIYEMPEKIMFVTNA